MPVGVGLAVLPEGDLFPRTPSLGSWIALAALVAMIAAYYMLVRPERTTSTDVARQLRIEEHGRRFGTVVALVGPGLAMLSHAHPLGVGWWLVAGPAFSIVLLASAFMLVLILAHPREALFVPLHQRVGAWFVTSLLLAATLCIPLGYLVLSTGADRDATVSLACAMCAAYILAVIAALLVHQCLTMTTRPPRPPELPPHSEDKPQSADAVLCTTDAVRFARCAGSRSPPARPSTWTLA